jgi:hypothetical protein
MTHDATVRSITAKLALAIARLNTSIPAAWEEAERDIVEAALLVSTLLQRPDPVERAVLKVLDGGAEEA